MSKHKIIGLLACLLAVGLLLTVKYHPRTVPIEECSQLYRDFADNPHVAVAFIKDFHVNDTLAVDVTTLQADSDSAWCALLRDFGEPEDLINLYNTNRNLFVGEDVNAIEIFYIDKDDTKKHLSVSNLNSLLVIGSHKKKSLCIFHAEEEKYKNIIGLTQIQDLKR